MRLIGTLLAAAAAASVMVSSALAAAAPAALRGLSTCPSSNAVVLRVDNLRDDYLVNVQLSMLARLRVRKVRYSATLLAGHFGQHQELLDSVSGDYANHMCEVCNGGMHDGLNFHNMSYAEATEQVYQSQMSVFKTMGAWPTTFHPPGGLYSRGTEWALYKYGVAGMSTDTSTCTRDNCLTSRPVWHAPARLNCSGDHQADDNSTTSHGGMQLVQVTKMVEEVQATVQVYGFAVIRVSAADLADANGNECTDCMKNFEDLLDQLQANCNDMQALEDLNQVNRTTDETVRDDQAVQDERMTVDGSTSDDSGTDGNTDTNTDGDVTITVHDDVDSTDYVQDDAAPATAIAVVAGMAAALAAAALAA